MVVDTALRTLHPVDDAPSIWIRRAVSPNRDTRITRPTDKLFRNTGLRHHSSLRVKNGELSRQQKCGPKAAS
jgi:hypothetical protein